MPDFSTAAWIAFTFLLAGSVKGVIGMGLPLIALGLLTPVTGLHAAMAIMLGPAFVTNVWQALSGGETRSVLTRTWPFLLASTACIWIGALALSRVDVRLLSGLLGFLLAAYGVMGLVRPPIHVSPERRTLTGVVAGAINGVLAGMTGSFSIPGVPWLQAIGLSRGELMQAMGMLFSLSSVALALALGRQNLLGKEQVFLSAAAVVLSIGGMLIGQAIRTRLSERQFRLVFFWSLIALGAYIVAGTAIR
jgi:uncharacterized membrane protein YfcA